MTAAADGKLLMFGTCEQGVWLAEDGQRQDARKLFRADSPILSAAVGPGARLIVTGHEDRTTHLWGADGKPLGKPLSHAAPVQAVAVSGDGTLFATAAGKGVRLWDAATHQPIGRPLAHDADVLSLAFSADGKALLTGDRGGAVRQWQVPAPSAADGRRLKLWVEVMAGKELDAAGFIHPLNETTLQDRRQKLQALGGPLRAGAE
jgi:WD40 repeat protein